MDNDNMDRRKHQRIDIERAIYIEVVEKGSRTETDNMIVRCETLEVSVGGLRVSVPIAIPQGSMLNIAVPADAWKDNLELVGKAIWVREAADEEGYWVGLELQDSSPENMRRWFNVVQKLKKHPEPTSVVSD